MQGLVPSYNLTTISETAQLHSTPRTCVILPQVPLYRQPRQLPHHLIVRLTLPYRLSVLRPPCRLVLLCAQGPQRADLWMGRTFSSLFSVFTNQAF